MKNLEVKETGYSLSRKFWNFAFENPHLIKPHHSSIFFFSVEHCNRMGWKSVFGFPTTMAMEAVGIKSYRTYIKHFNDLVDFGFITIVERSKNQFSSNIISIFGIASKDKADDKALVKALQKQMSKQVQSTCQGSGESIDSIIKPITYNLLTNNLELICHHSDLLEKFISDLKKINTNKNLDPFCDGIPEASETELDQLWNFFLSTTQTEYSLSTYRDLAQAALGKYDFEILKKVIELKTFQTTTGEFNRKWLRPSTIFKPEKLESYVQEVRDYEAGRNTPQKNDKASIAKRNAQELERLEKLGF